MPAPKGSCIETPSLPTAAAVEEKEETCPQTGMQSHDQPRAFFFHPLMTRDRQVTDGCQEEEPHTHKPRKKQERQQQQKGQGCGGGGISAQAPVPGLL